MHSSSARAPKLQLAIEQPSTGRYRNPPQNDAPCPRTKEKPQQNGRRGTITIKPNPAGLVTHKLENNNGREALTQL